MNNFFKVVGFELNNYFKSKAYILTTVLITAFLIVGICLPSMVDLSGIIPQLATEEKAEEDEKAKSEEDKSKYAIYDENNIIDMEYLKSFYPNSEWQTASSNDELEKLVKDGQVEGGFEVESLTKYTYFVKNKGLHDSEQAVFDQALGYMYKQQAISEKGLDFNEIDAIYNMPIESNVNVLGKDSSENYFYAYILVFVLYFMIIMYGQLIATSFGLMRYEIPMFGLYGACSTMGEALSLGAMCVNAGYAQNVIAIASSHFASAEKQFRYPLEYGNQRPVASTWTVTGAGAYIVGDKPLDKKKCVLIKGITTGKIVDYGVKDSMNMGACMAPAAAELIEANFKDLDVDKDYYDAIFTGDLGEIGNRILSELLKEKGIDIADKLYDCGMLIYEGETKCSGGSGCGCSAVVLGSCIMDRLIRGEYKRVLFVPTGALLSTVSYNEGKSVPGIAHGVILEGKES